MAEDVIKTQQSDLDTELATLQAKRANLWADTFGKGKDMNKNTMVWKQAKLAASRSDIERRLSQIKAFQVLQGCLSRQGLIGFEVPGDGNCGLYSLCCLSNDRPFADGDGDIAKSLRQTLSEMWVKASTIDRWITIYSHMVLAVQSKHAEVKKEVAEESSKHITPQKRKAELGLVEFGSNFCKH